MRLGVDGDGNVRIDRLSPEVVAVLAQIPELLDSEDPEVRDSLRQRTYQDDAEEEQWQRYAGPELRHLFASRAAIVREDLLAVEPDGSSFGGFGLTIRVEHRQAWIAALNGANHSLVARHGLTAADLERRPGELGDPDRDMALASLEVMAVLLHVLLDVDGHGFPDRDVIDSWREEDHPDGSESAGG